MSFSRRTFLAGAATGVTTLVLAACTPVRPAPTASPSVVPTPTSGVPLPSGVLRSNWGSDEFARGSHSFIASHATPGQRAVLREPIAGRLFFAGEATSDERPATVEGASESGVRAATEILAIAEPGERIAVIGAGAAGAAAASRLSDYGFEVTVIEARERTGGRIDTRTDDAWPLPVELGAAWAPERGSSVSLRLASLGISTAPVEGDTAVRVSDGEDVGASDTGENAIASALAWARERPDDVSVTEAIAGSNPDLSEGGAPPTPADRVAATLLQQIGIGRGADPEALSAWYGFDEPAAPTEERVTDGYGAYVDALLEGLDVWLSTSVTALSYGDNGVSIRLATGESASVDRAVLTVPLGVLKDEGIGFDPALPFERRAAIADLGFATTDTVWVRFDEVFWDTDAVRWSVLGSELPITEWVNLEPSTGEPVLVGLVAGAQGAALAELDEAGVIEAVTESLLPFSAER